jgi:hypothetical protein
MSMLFNEGRAEGRIHHRGRGVTKLLELQQVLVSFTPTQPLSCLQKLSLRRA